MASHQCQIIGWLTSSGPGVGGPTVRPSKARNESISDDTQEAFRPGAPHRRNKRLTLSSFSGSLSRGVPADLDDIAVGVSKLDRDKVRFRRPFDLANPLPGGAIPEGADSFSGR